jgi:hypothetical protein
VIVLVGTPCGRVDPELNAPPQKLKFSNMVTTYTAADISEFTTTATTSRRGRRQIDDDSVYYGKYRDYDFAKEFLVASTVMEDTFLRYLHHDGFTYYDILHRQMYQFQKLEYDMVVPVIADRNYFPFQPYPGFYKVMRMLLEIKNALQVLEVMYDCDYMCEQASFIGEKVLHQQFLPFVPSLIMHIWSIRHVIERWNPRSTLHSSYDTLVFEPEFNLEEIMDEVEPFDFDDGFLEFVPIRTVYFISGQGPLDYYEDWLYIDADHPFENGLRYIESDFDRNVAILDAIYKITANKPKEILPVVISIPPVPEYFDYYGDFYHELKNVVFLENVMLVRDGFLSLDEIVDILTPNGVAFWVAPYYIETHMREMFLFFKKIAMRDGTNFDHPVVFALNTIPYPNGTFPGLTMHMALFGIMTHEVENFMEYYRGLNPEAVAILSTFYTSRYVYEDLRLQDIQQWQVTYMREIYYADWLYHDADNEVEHALRNCNSFFEEKLAILDFIHSCKTIGALSYTSAGVACQSGYVRRVENNEIVYKPKSVRSPIKKKNAEAKDKRVDTIRREARDIKRDFSQSSMPGSWFSSSAIKDEVSKLNDTLSSIADAKAPAVDKMNDLTSKIEELKAYFMTEMPEQIKSQTHDLLETVGLRFKDMKIDRKIAKHTVGIASVTTFVFAGIHYMKTRDNLSLAIAIISGLTSFCYSSILYSPDCWKPLFDFWKRITSGDPKDVPQAGTAECNNLATVLTTVLNGYVCSKAGTSDQSITRLLNSAANFDRQEKGFEGVLKRALIFLEGLVNYFRKQLGMQEPVVFWSYQSHTVNTFLDSAAEIICAIDEKRFPMTQNNYLRVFNTILEGQRIQKEIPRDKEYPDVFNALSQQLNLLIKIRAKFNACNFKSDGLRQETTTSWYVGAPGGGKSVIIVFEHDAVAAHILDDEEFALYKQRRQEFVFNYNPECEYIDGYIAQKFLFIDDFGQNRTVAGTGDNEWMFWIRMACGFPMKCHMAGVDDKGNTYIQTLIASATSNLMSLKNESIISEAAMWRRIDHCWCVYPAKAHCTPETQNVDPWSKQFDYSTLPLEANGVSVIKPENLRFRRWNMMTGTYEGNEMRFDEIVAMKVELYHIKKKRFENMMEQLELHQDRARAEHLGVVAQSALKEVFGDIQMEDIQEENDIQDLLDISHIPSVNEFMNRYITISKEDSKTGMDLRSRALEAQIVVCEHNDFEKGVFLTPEQCLQVLLERFGKEALTALINEERGYWNGFINRVYTCTKFSEIHLPKIVISQRYDRSTWKKLKIWFSSFIEKAEWIVSKSIVPLFNGALSIVKKADQYFPMLKWILLLAFGAFGIKRYFFSEEPRLADLMVIQHASPDDLLTQYSVEELKQALPTVLTEQESVGKIWEGLLADPVSQSMHRAHTGGKGPKRNVNKAKSFRKPQVVRTEGNIGDDGGHAIANSLRNRNMYEMFMETNPGKDDYQFIGHCFFILDRIASVPLHYITDLADILEKDPELIKARIKIIKYTRDDAPMTYILNVEEFMSDWESDGLEESDLALVRFPENVKPHGNVLKYLCTREDVEKFSSADVTLYSGTKVAKSQVFTRAYKLVTAISVASHHGSPHDLTSGFTYLAHTDIGHCGSILCMMNAFNGPRKIVGLHVAGNKVRGYAGALLLEDVKICLDKLVSLTGKPVIEMEVSTEAQCWVPFGTGQFELLAKLEHPVRAGTKTSIVPSKLHGLIIPPEKKPAKLRDPIIDGKPFSLFGKSIQKYCTPDLYISSEDIGHVEDAVYDFYMKNRLHVIEHRVLTIEEAILGLENEPDFKSLNRSSSMGFPLSEMSFPGCRGKQAVFGKEQEYNLDNPNFRTLVKAKCEEMIECASRGIRLDVYFKDSLKDELLPIEKVDDNKVRLFMAVMLAYCIVFRMYFGTLSLEITKNKIYNSSAVGMNPYSLDWHLMCKRFLKFGTPVTKMTGAGDYSGYDGSEKPKIHWGIFRVLMRILKGKSRDELIRYVLWYEVVNSRHIFQDMMYDWPSSLPSGHPWTIFINNFYNLFAFRLCWLDLHDGEPSCLIFFDDHVVLVVQGDDNVFTVSFEYRELFTELYLSKAMLKYGLTYTSETKGTVNNELRPYTAIKFLKRSSRFCEIKRRWVAPLDLHTILEIPMWTKRKDFDDSIVLSNVDAALRELTLHGEDKFNVWAPYISSLLFQEYGMWPRCTSFRALYHEVLELEEYY